MTCIILTDFAPDKNLFFLKTNGTDLKLTNAQERHYQIGIKKVMSLLRHLFFDSDHLLISTLDKLLAATESLLETIFKFPI